MTSSVIVAVRVRPGMAETHPDGSYSPPL
jgi:hypothetical protein